MSTRGDREIERIKGAGAYYLIFRFASNRGMRTYESGPVSRPVVRKLYRCLKNNKISDFPAEHVYSQWIEEDTIQGFRREVSYDSLSVGGGAAEGSGSADSPEPGSSAQSPRRQHAEVKGT